MNMNEVIATVATNAGHEVHPNDHVNASQSSNDTFPTSIHVAAAIAVSERLLPALATLEHSLSAKADEFAGLVKSGRTHLMDATPVMLGQEFGGYAATVRYAAERLESVLPRVRELPLGGTAVGTGINTPPGFAARVIEVLAEDTGQPFTEARDHFEAQGTRDSLVELSGVLRTIAVGLTKICNDLRWMSSGPTTGLAEIHLPDLQPGSSIMPGKVNPVLPEATLMVCAQVIGNDATVAWSPARAGNFELNVMLPVIARNVLESIRLLANASTLLAERCVDGITANAERMRTYAESSPSVVTPLNKYVGYENAAKIAKQALADGSDDPRDRDRDGLRRARRPHRGAARRGARRREHDPPVSDLTEPESVRRQYASEGNLETRRLGLAAHPDGRDPTAIAARVVHEAEPRAILEVGCGTGAFAERMVAENPGAVVLATDLRNASSSSPASAASRRRSADIQALPFADASYDVVAAIGCSTTCPTSTRAARGTPRAAPGRPVRRGDQRRRAHGRSCAATPAARRR